MEPMIQIPIKKEISIFLDSWLPYYLLKYSHDYYILPVGKSGIY